MCDGPLSEGCIARDELPPTTGVPIPIIPVYWMRTWKTQTQMVGHLTLLCIQPKRGTLEFWDPDGPSSAYSHLMTEHDTMWLPELRRVRPPDETLS